MGARADKKLPSILDSQAKNASHHYQSTTVDGFIITIITSYNNNLMHVA